MKHHETPEGFLARARDEARDVVLALSGEDDVQVPSLTESEWVEWCRKQRPKVMQWLRAPTRRRRAIEAKLAPADKMLFLWTILAHLHAAKMALDANRCGRIEPRTTRDHVAWLMDWADTATTLWDKVQHPLWPFAEDGHLLLTDGESEYFEVRGFGLPGQPTAVEIRSKHGSQKHTI
jgi:hypothetical protein